MLDYDRPKQDTLQPFTKFISNPRADDTTPISKIVEVLISMAQTSTHPLKVYK